MMLVAHMRCEDLGLRDSCGRTVLHLAARKASPLIVGTLLDKMSQDQVTMVDDEGRNCLHAAALEGCKTIIGLLAKNASLLHGKNLYGETPLAIAAGMGRRQRALIPLMLASGGDANAVSHNGWSLLHSAAIAGDRNLTDVLVNAGADINATTGTGWTVLHLDASGANEELLEQHLEAGADPDIETMDKWTALTLAIALRKVTMAQKLLLKGANPLLRDSYGRCAIEWAACDPSLQGKIDFGEHEIGPSSLGQQQSTLRTTICACIEGSLASIDVKSRTSRHSYNRLGHYLLAFIDEDEALTAFLHAVFRNSSAQQPSHSVICNICDDDDFCIQGTRYICCSCVDTDLCALCMEKYNSASLRGEICWGHNFMKVSGEDWEALPPGKVNQAGETKEQWLRRLAKKYGEG